MAEWIGYTSSLPDGRTFSVEPCWRYTIYALPTEEDPDTIVIDHTESGFDTAEEAEITMALAMVQ